MVHAFVPEVRELKDALERYGVSATTAARFIGCAVRTVYNWIEKETVPSPLMRRQIREGIARMEEELGAPAKVRIYYTRRAILDKLTADEKIALNEFVAANYGTPNFEEQYLKFLEGHAKRLGVKVQTPPGGRVPEAQAKLPPGVKGKPKFTRSTPPPAPAEPKPAPPPEPARPTFSAAELANLERRYHRGNKQQKADILDVLKRLGVDPLPAWATNGGDK